jgi:ribosome-binding factor A
MAKHPTRPPSQRQLKVGELIRHALSDMFLRGDIYGPNREAFTLTVSEVRVGPDLRNATIYVMPLGGKEKEKVVQQLNDISSMLRGELNHRVELRFSPALYFKLDESFETASKLENLLRDPRVAQDLAKPDKE